MALAKNGAQVRVSSVDRSFFNSAEEVNKVYKEMYNLGVKWNRIGQWGDWTCWSIVEREKNKYQIDPVTDKAITDSIKNGVNILYTLCYGNPIYEETKWLADLGPVWTTGHPFTGQAGPTKKESIEGFVNYAKFVAKHFLGRVKWYEIWNEENSWAWYGEPPDPKAFGKLVLDTAKALKEIDPEIKVMVGGTAALAPQFISDALEVGGGPYIDAIAFHPYTMPYPEMGLGALDVVDGKQIGRDKKEFGYSTYLEMIEFYRKHFSKYNPNLEFWANEWNAIPTVEDSPYKGVSELQSAKQCARFFIMATLSGVRGVWWSLLNRNFVYDWAVLRSEDFSKRPLYYTIQAICTLMSGAKPDQSIKIDVKTDATDLWCKAFRGRYDETLLVLWRAVSPEDESKLYKVSLKVGCDAKRIFAVDTIHSKTQRIIFTKVKDNIVINDLLVSDYPIILSLK